MTAAPRRGRGRAVALLAAGLAGAAALALAGNGEQTDQRTRPPLMLLTTLPLMFGESFGLDSAGSPALEALERRFTVIPISTTAKGELAQGEVLLMAHPLAQTTEALVDLDAWVRSGGRVLLLADPALEWHSERPLGDSLRAPPSFADTGLLAHWGLRLDAPDARGPAKRRLAGRDIVTVSPGELFGDCAIGSGRLVARCRVGKGRATVVADADFLNLRELGGEAGGNLDALAAELDSLRRD